MLSKIKTWFNGLFDKHENLSDYLKIHGTTVIVLFVLVVASIFLVFPKQHDVSKELNKKYVELSKAYESDGIEKTTTNSIDQVATDKLQGEIADIQTDNKPVQWLSLIIVSTFLCTLATILANFSQFIYTKVKFTFAIVKEGSGNSVLSAALIGCFIVVAVVYYIMFGLGQGL